MKSDDLRAAIVAFLGSNTETPATASQISSALALRGKQRKQLQKWLHDLVVDGSIVKIRGDRYAMGEPADLFTGTFSVSRSGRAFLETPKSPERIQIPDLYCATALPGDTVVVRLQDPPGTTPGRRRGEPEDRVGKVIRIVARARHDIVGTLKSTGRFLYVAPLAPAYTHDLYVPDAGGARIEDRVVVRFTGWANRHVNPEGEIVEVLGRADDPSTDTIAIVRHHGLRDAFPDEVLREAEQASELADRPGPRLDLRERVVVTIDPERARDFDDAISLDADADGNRVLGVHIADVAHFVRPGSALDGEARERGNSVYLVDAVLPMLPEQLSNGVCSLNPHVDRLAFSVFLTVDAEGAVLRREFARSVIRSRLRLTYEQAMEALRARESGAPAVPEPIRGLLRGVDALARQWRGQRFARYALDLDVPECEILLGRDGRLQGVRAVPHDASHQLIEECMVAANEAVASELAARGVPLISRVHEPPREAAIERLTADLVAMGYRPGDLSVPRNLAHFLKSIADDPAADYVRTAVLRAMSRAVYSAAGSGHFGLAKRFYCHFTSPIRRYPDLTVHRQLAAALARPARRVSGREELAAAAEHCTATELKADEAERDLVEIKKLRFLQQQIDDGAPVDYDAVVVNVFNFGLLVDVPALQQQGLVHVSAISDRFVRHNRETRTLRAGNRSYGIGRRLRVRVSKVDFGARRVDYAPVG